MRARGSSCFRVYSRGAGFVGFYRTPTAPGVSWIRPEGAKIRLTCKTGVESKSHLELSAAGGPGSPHTLELSQVLTEITYKIAEDRSNQSEQNAECGGSCAVGGRMPNQPIAKKADNGIGWVGSAEGQNLQEPQVCAHVSHRVGEG